MSNKMIRLPPVLRPRLTWRYILGASVALYVSYCFLFSSTLFASNLPQHTGPYTVGTIDIEIPCEQREISDLNRKDTREPAFKLDTVLFSIYYPAENAWKTKPKHYWVPKPVSLTAEGYASFGHINNFITNSILTASLWGLIGGIQISAFVDIDLNESAPKFATQGSGLQEVAADAYSEGSLPVFVFSHGFASSRTDYTHYLGELASRGYVVAAIEHRDGSSPASVVMKEGAEDRVVFPIRQGDIEEQPDFNTSVFKKAQLDFRQAEIEETVRVLHEINNGRGGHMFKLNSRKEGRDLKAWQGRLNMGDVTLGGHSFGATGALQALKGAPSSKLPFRGGIILDPGKSSGRLNSEVDVPIFVIHSNSWSSKHSVFFDRPHFDVVKELVQGVVDKGKGAWFMTSLGTSHPSVTDAPLIEPLLLSWTTGATIDVKEGVEQYVSVSEQFLKFQHEGQRTGLLAQSMSHPSYNNPEVVGMDLDAKYSKYWQIHVAPKAT